MSDTQFRRFSSILTWLTLLLVGLGSEFLVGGALLASMTEERAERLTHYWHYIQFVFPLLAVMAFGEAARQSWLSLLFTVLALWKGGFPDTVASFAIGLTTDGHHHRLDAALSMAYGSATLLHHSSAALLIATLVNGAAGYSQYIASGIWPLVVQHWFVLLRYKHHLAYCAVVLGLEVYFEIQVFAALERFYRYDDWLVRQAALGMLLAHWIYLIRGGARLLQSGLHEWGTKLKSQARLNIFSLHQLDEEHPLPSEHSRHQPTQSAAVKRHATLMRWSRATSGSTTATKTLYEESNESETDSIRTAEFNASEYHRTNHV